jgi:hypothetical protein
MRAPRVILKPRRAQPFFGRHPWVFAGAIASVEGEPRDGAEVDLVSHAGNFVARGLFNGQSKIRVRLAPDDALRIQHERLGRTLRGRDRMALLDVRTVLMAQKLFAARNGGYYGPFECLTKPETCLADFPKEEAPFLDPTHDWLVTREVLRSSQAAPDRQFRPARRSRRTYPLCNTAANYSDCCRRSATSS